MSSENTISVKTLFWTLFWGTILVLLLLYVYAQLHVARLALDAQGNLSVHETYFDDWQQTLPEVFAAMRSEFETADDAFAASVSTKIDAAFEPVYERIPAFLDFHYSVVGEYTEIAAAFQDRLGGNFEKMLFTDADFDSRMRLANAELNADGMRLIEQALDATRTRMADQLRLNPDEMGLVSRVATLTIDDAKARFENEDLWIKGGSAAVGAGVVTAVVVKTLSTKIGTTLAAKGGVKLLVKGTGSIAGGAASGAGGSLLCGPGAPACAMVLAPLGALAAWYLSDKAIVEVDELINREQFEQDVRAAIDEEKQRIKEKMLDQYRHSLQTILSANEGGLKNVTVRQRILDGI